MVKDESCNLLSKDFQKLNYKHVAMGTGKGVDLSDL